MSENRTYSRRLAEWCAALIWDDIPADARAKLPLRLLDTTGLIFAGAHTMAGVAASAYARDYPGVPQSTLATHESRVPAPIAALVHGIEAHCHDFDDTFLDSVVHPGSVVIPAALAVAEARSVSNEEFGVAITAGYEIAARVGAVAGRRLHARNLHPTGIVGPIAASVTAGRLLGLSGERIAWAMGLAASMSGGLRAFAVDGGWSKWLHAGWAAHGGIVAAEMAARGFRGPEHVLEGGYDLYSALLHGDAIDPSGLVQDLGQSWKGVSAEFKYYPCAHVIQPYIDALLPIVRQYGLQPADIAEIECTIAPWAAAVVCEPRAAKLRPETELEATGSLPYQLAVAVFERRVDLSALAPEMRRRSDIRTFAGRIRCREDAKLGRDFDGAIRVRTVRGNSHESTATAAKADPDKLRQKFVGLVGPVCGTGFAEDAAAALLQRDGPDWRWSSNLLSRAVRPDAKEESHSETSI